MKVGILGSGDGGEGAGRGVSPARPRRDARHAGPGEARRLGRRESEGPGRLLRRRGGVRRARRARGERGRGRRGPRGRGRRQPRGQDGRRRHQSNRRRAAGQRRPELLHQSRRLADGAPAARIRRRAVRQGVQLGRQRVDGEPAVRRRPADDVHLRQRRGGEEDGRARSSTSSAGTTADMGAAEAARAIEPLCILWCIPGFLANDWVHAFKLLR